MMKARLLLAILLAMTACSVFAKTKTVEGSAVFYIPSTMTRVQAEEEAIRRAKINALNKAFGNSIISSNTSIATESDERFFSNGFELVKGEWIETIGSPEIKTCLDGEEVFLSVKIKGRARQKRSAEINLLIKVLRNGLTPNCEASEFRNGDKMYLHFVSPSDGYVSVYQYDPVAGNVYCLLPYKKDGSGSVAVEHDREYVFFAKSMSANPALVDEYRLECTSDGEVNTLYVIFSPNRFSKSTTEGNGKYTPRSVPLEKFEAWKAMCQAQDEMMIVVTKNIIINK